MKPAKPYAMRGWKHWSEPCLKYCAQQRTRTANDGTVFTVLAHSEGWNYWLYINGELVNTGPQGSILYEANRRAKNHEGWATNEDN